MPLTLTMLRCPQSVPPQTRSVAGGEFSIGRGPDNDWVLPDPERGISKCHCVLAFRSGGWQIADLSTNGTFLNREAVPIGRGQTRNLRDGDRVNLGPYEIEARINESALAPGAPPRPANPFAEDIFEAQPRPAPGAAGDPFAADLAPPSISLPPDFDPLAPDPPDERFGQPAQSDHTPHLEDAFIPPAAHAVLPENWDRDAVPPARPEPVLAPPVAPPAEQPSARPAAPPTAAEAVPPRASEDLLAAFLRGCEVRDVRPADPQATMQALGAAFRALVAGLRQAMMARATVKSEFRIEQTQLRSRGNNPIRFSADDEDALMALLEVGRRTEMGPAEAVRDALRDMRAHEIAMVAAMRAAIREMLEAFDPAKLRRAAERSGLNLVPVQRRAHAWDEFEAVYAKVSQALEDDFDSVFGKAFARAYERALSEAAARGPGG